jgi:glucose/arabinose dehydrogenase
LIIYSGTQRRDWEGHAFIGGLRSRALLRVDIDETKAIEAERFTWGQRIRDVEEGPDGTLWVIEDGPKGRLIRLSLD